jgi:hypothetical protein
VPDSAVPRYIVTHPRPMSGMGSNLASLAGAIWFAKQLGRDLVVDWRGLECLKDKAANFFTEFYEAPREIQGVRMHYAPCPELPEPIAQFRELSIGEAVAMVKTGDEASHLVLGDFHSLERLDPGGKPRAQFWRLQDFYRHIKLRSFVQAEVDRFADEHFRGAFVVGLNLAGGNGEFAKGSPYFGRVDTNIFSKERQFLNKVERAYQLALRGLPRYLRPSGRMFFATDSLAMHDLLAKLPNTVTRRTVFPPPGVGRYFSGYTDPGYTDRDSIVDSLTDMFLLARCQALIRNGTAFNLYANTVTNCFNGNSRHLESMYARYWIKASYRYGMRVLGR